MLIFPADFTSIYVEVLGPWMNRGDGHGLQVPDTSFNDEKVGWLRKKIKEVEHSRLEKCLKRNMTRYPIKKRILYLNFSVFSQF